MSFVSQGPGRRQGIREGGPVYHQGWYPLALSSELTRGALLGRDFLGGRVILYRDPTGKPVVQSGYCPHLGTDLSVGDLVDGQVRCAFHHWTFDKTGRCIRIPTEDKIPPGAKIFTYPSAEAWGLVWAFTGPEPLFALPFVPRMREADLVYRTQKLGLCPFEPWLPSSNGFDFQHLRSVHGMHLNGPDKIEVRDYNIEYTLAEGKTELHGLLSGTNTFSMYRSDSGHATFRIWTGTPTRHGETMAYSVVGLLDTHPRTQEERQSLERQLDDLTVYMDKLRKEDEQILNAVRFRQGVLVAADRHLSRYFKYVREFPTAEFIESCA